jgi:hypothetical protein
MFKRSQFFTTRLAFSCAAFSLTACSPGILSERGSYLRDYHTGDFKQAESQLNQIVQKEIGLDTHSKNATWILLDRATTRFALGKTEEAIQDYAKALEALNYFNQEVPAEQLAQILLQDEVGAYQASDFEQVLARVYFALALLHQGDEQNAYAILRQAEEYQQIKRNIYTKIPFIQQNDLADSSLSKYLFATLLDKRGDHANASILYQQAIRLLPGSDSRQKECRFQDGQATVLILCHNGKAPYKISATSPASVASAVALEMLLGNRHRDPLISTLCGLPVPALQQWPYSNPIPIHAYLDGYLKTLQPYYNIQQAAATELKQQMPVIVAKGVARLLLRRFAVESMRKQDPSLGNLADLTMCLINVNTRADTRSWTTLPALIDLAHFQVQAGIHHLQIQVQDPLTGPQHYSYELSLKSNHLCIIHIFTIQPGHTRILIPHRHLTIMTPGNFQVS